MQRLIDKYAIGIRDKFDAPCAAVIVLKDTKPDNIELSIACPTELNPVDFMPAALRKIQFQIQGRGIGEGYHADEPENATVLKANDRAMAAFEKLEVYALVGRETEDGPLDIRAGFIDGTPFPFFDQRLESLEKLMSDPRVERTQVKEEWIVKLTVDSIVKRTK